jgi:hypothetical protein
MWSEISLKGWYNAEGQVKLLRLHFTPAEMEGEVDREAVFDPEEGRGAMNVLVTP